jgi:hypothetical protein
MLNDFELEKLERKYFEYFLTFLTANLHPIIEGLNSRIKILNDWFEVFIKTARKGYKHPSDLDTGAERIFHHFFASILHIPNSSPVGADLMFEVYDAFIHIEVKTALLDNPADYKGKVNISDRQTSYGAKGIFSPSLPSYYHPQGEEEKPCLSYVIQVIHEQAKPDIKALLLISIPNGQLFPIYGKSIISGGKVKGKSFRYKYSAIPYFKLLTTEKDKKFRVEVVYLSKNLKPEDITGIKNIPIHFQF